MSQLDRAPNRRISTSYPDPQPLTIARAAEILVMQAEGLCMPELRALCRSDCCCSLPGARGRVVAVTFPDLVTMAQHLFALTTEEELLDEVAVLLRRYCSLSPYTGAYMLTGKEDRCPFLTQDGHCAIYEARPMLCRLFFHCEWIGNALHWDWQLDGQVMQALLALAQELARKWPSQLSQLWRHQRSYELIPLISGASGA